MKRALTIAALLLAAACKQQGAVPAAADESGGNTENPANAPVSAPLEAEGAVPSLAGDWRVAALDGRPMGASVTASFQADKASLSSGCFRRSWIYTQKRNVVTFAANPAGSANCGGGVPGDDMQAAEDALGKANMAIFSDDGSEAKLSGYGGGLKLERR
jgi:hypothetical protein